MASEFTNKISRLLTLGLDCAVRKFSELWHTEDIMAAVLFWSASRVQALKFKLVDMHKIT